MDKLFRNLSPEERTHATACLGLHRRKASAGEILFREGEKANSIGFIVSGAVNIVRYSLDGRARVLTQVARGESFGTSFVLGGADRYFANIVAAEDTEVLLISGSRLLAPCSQRCPLHVNLLAHLLGALAKRNTVLARKIDCLTQHTTREKILAYLRHEAEAAGGEDFEIPFSRQDLADFLNVDRAGLSSEIGKLVREGVLTTKRRRFRLLRPDPQ